MLRRLHHPLWTHLPALAALFVFIIYLGRALPLPASAPVHFAPDGLPNQYGSPWLAAGLTLGLSLLFLAVSLILDELWARQERRKSFNWFSLMDELTVGFLCGVGVGYLSYLQRGAERFTFPTIPVLVLGGGALALGIMLELRRPFRGEAVVPPAGQALSPELAARLRSGAPFVYWDAQNPAYVTLLTVGGPLVMLGAAVVTFARSPWVALILAASGLLMTLPYGGLRIMVTRQELTLRFGLLGFRVLRLPLREVTASEAVTFSPLRDFGGYGIRYGGGTAAYYLQGHEGVRLTTASGKKYLIGSGSAPTLAGIIRTLAEQQHG